MDNQLAVIDSEAGPSNAAIVPAPAEAEVDLSKHPSGIVPMLQNVVATVNLGCPLDLKKIAQSARNAEYNPKRFAAVIMRIREPKTTALIFSSGKVVCTGAKSEQDSRVAARKYAKIICKLGFDQVSFKEFTIQNIVASCDVKFPIRLEGLYYSHGLFASYEPELFPGLIYRMKKPKIVLLIFVSGKVVLTGAKKRHEIYEAFENIYPTLTEFRKSDIAPAPAPLPAIAAAADTADGGEAAAEGREAKRMRGEGGFAMPPPRLPPPTPAHTGLPPATPYHGGGVDLPPMTPMHSHGLPPPTPAYQSGLPPPTPAYHNSLPPPTPLHPANSGAPIPLQAPKMPVPAFNRAPVPAFK